MDRLFAFIEKVCERPGMFVGKPDMRLIETLLGGYEIALIDTNNLQSAVFRDFTDWLSATYPSQTKGKGEVWWSEKLIEMYGEEGAIKQTPVLFKKWSDQRHRE